VKCVVELSPLLHVLIGLITEVMILLERSGKHDLIIKYG
jgi:hypothetical protein